jgi:DNA-binding LacI/PurR family transcriptional regulator
MEKVHLATQMIKERIAFADHMANVLPAERQLADELGINRYLVRKVLQELVDQGTLLRQENGRLEIAAPTDGSHTCTIGFIAPPGRSANRDEWLEGITSVAASLAPQHSIVVRPITYGHWADPAIQEALTYLDGALFMASEEKIPAWLLTKIHESPCRLLSLDNDHSQVGLPSILLFSPAAERKLFEHLYRLGHRNIDCINTQHEDAIIRDRISAWQSFKQSRGIGGQLRSLAQSEPIELAYRLVRSALQEGQPLASALFCTTGPAAVGVMRALQEAGLRTGEDVSVCAVNSEGLGRYLLPSLTALEAPPRTLYLRRVLEWMMGYQEWQGPLLIQPDDVLLFEGESTGPSPLSKAESASVVITNNSAVVIGA